MGRDRQDQKEIVYEKAAVGATSMLAN